MIFIAWYYGDFYHINLWYGFYINCVCLQGFPIDSCEFAGELDYDNNLTISLVYHILVVSPRSVTGFTRPFLTRRCVWFVWWHTFRECSFSTMRTDLHLCMTLGNIPRLIVHVQSRTITTLWKSADFDVAQSYTLRSLSCLSPPSPPFSSSPFLSLLPFPIPPFPPWTCVSHYQVLLGDGDCYCMYET